MSTTEGVAMGGSDPKSAVEDLLASVHNADWKGFQEATTDSDIHPEFAKVSFEFAVTLQNLEKAIAENLGEGKWDEFRETTGPETRSSWPPPHFPEDASWFQPSPQDKANGIVYFRFPQSDVDRDSIVRFNEKRGRWTVDLLMRDADPNSVPGLTMFYERLTEGYRNAIAAIEAGEKDLGVLMDTVAKPLTRRDDD